MAVNINEVVDQMQALGLPRPPDGILSFGRFVRYGPNKRAWYKFHEFATDAGDVVIVGTFGMWGTVESTRVEIDWKGISPESQAKIRADMRAAEQREIEKRNERAWKAANRAREQWGSALKSDAPECVGSPYLQRKLVDGEACRFFTDGTLLVPILRYDDENAGAKLVGLQKISPDGTKRFNKGMAMEGGACRLGDAPADGDVILITEGYATGLSIRMATHRVLTLFCAFNAGNLKAVAEIVRAKYPHSPIVFCSDDDWKTERADKTPWNPGTWYANIAARAIGNAYMIVPIFPVAADRQDKWTDYNDLHVNYGLDAVAAQMNLADVMAAQSPTDLSSGLKVGDLWPDAVSGANIGGDGGDGPPDEGGSTSLWPDGENGSGAGRGATWWDRLQRSSSGAIKPSLNNAFMVLTNHRDWKDVLGFDQYSELVHKLKVPPFEGAEIGEWRDIDDTRTKLWLSRRIGEPPDKAITDAVVLSARRNEFHELKDYLESLEHDGTARLRMMMFEYFGACTDIEFKLLPQDEQDRCRIYCEKAAEKWMIGAVARVLKPGCRMDNMLILEGDQGLMKSTALSVLAGKWFIDCKLDFNNKDSLLALQGYWIVEMAELEGMNKADTSETKRFLTHLTDFYRPPYGRKVEKKPRRCVFAGTVNPDVYLKDDTGNRRFWPVRCVKVDIEKLTADRDQLWAEAVKLYGAGVKWWVLPEEKHYFAEQQDRRFVEDAWTGRLVDYLDGELGIGELREVTTDQCLTALKLPVDRWDRQALQRVGSVLKRLGWIRRRKTTGKRTWSYFRPDPDGHAPEMPPKRDANPPGEVDNAPF